MGQVIGVGDVAPDGRPPFAFRDDVIIEVGKAAAAGEQVELVARDQDVSDDGRDAVVLSLHAP